MGIKNNKIKNWQPWVIVVLGALACGLMLQDYFRVLQAASCYRGWPVLMIVLVVLYVKRWKDAPPAKRFPSRRLIVSVVVVGLLMLLASIVYFVPYVSAIAWILLMGGLMLYLLRFRTIENALGLWLLLFLFVRFPFQLQLRVLAWMENLSVRAASHILDYGSVIHSVQGELISLPKHDFKISLLCSDWVSIVSVVAVASVLAVIKNRKWPQAISLLLLALLSTWLLNIFRILIVVSVQIWYKVDLLSGSWIWVYQLASFIVSLLFILGADALIVFVSLPIYTKVGKFRKKESRRERGERGGLRTQGRRRQKKKRGLSSVLALLSSAERREFSSGGAWVLMVCLLGVVGAASLAVYYRSDILSRKYMFDDAHLTRLDTNVVTFNRRGWEIIEEYDEKRDFDSVWGMYSKVWRLKYNELIVFMALDFPFDTWHDVKRCYGNLGWKIVHEEVIHSPEPFRWGASQTDMVLPNGDAAFILCSHCDHLGETVEPKPTENGEKLLLYKFSPSQMTPPFCGKRDKKKHTFYQTQCKVSSPRPLNEATKAEIRLMYAQFREEIRRAIAEAARR